MTIVVPNLSPIRPDHDIAAADFRGAMRQLVGGVSVVTVGQGQDISGMTVSSVTSLSIDPPSLIVAINRSASSWPLLVRDGVFGVNVLSADQRDIAERFTGKNGAKGRDRFAGRSGPRQEPARRFWSMRWSPRTARSRKSSSVIRTASSSAASAISSYRLPPRRWPIGRGNTSPSIATRTS